MRKPKSNTPAEPEITPAPVAEAQPEVEQDVPPVITPTPIVQPITPVVAPAPVVVPPKKSFFGLGKKKELSVLGAPKELKIKKKKVSRPSRLSYIGLGKEREAFIQNLATLLNAGLPLIDSIQTLQLEARNKPLKKLFQRILDSVEAGTPLWRALDDQNFFTPYAISLIRIGEEAGNLAQNMVYLSEQQEKDSALKAKVKMAMIYPTIVLVLVFVVVIGLGGFVLPNLTPVLYSLGAELPPTTRVVIGVSDFFTAHGLVAVPGMLLGMFGLFLLHTFTKFRVVTQWVMFRIPGVGRLAREATIARFGVILGGMLKAGVPLVDSMHSMAEVTWIESYRKLYFKMLERVNQGDSFQKCFKEIRGASKLLPISVQSLVVVGEKSGSLADILLKVSDIYDRKASETAQKLPVILEPMLLLFMGGLVGTIAYAIIIPIYSVVGNIG